MRLNLCCGMDIRDDCVNVDIVARPGFEDKVEIADIEESLPFCDNVFDEVLCLEALQYIKPWNFFNVMEEIWRVSKPEARIVVLHKNKDTELHYTRLTRHSMRYFVPGDFYNTHTMARFEIVRFKRLLSWPRFWRVHLKWDLKVIK